MANNKTYTVVKDGENLKELKTLAAAKKLADEHGGEVLCDGKCVYQGSVETPAEPVEDVIPTVDTEDPVGDAVAEEPGEERAEEPGQPAELKTEKYRLKALMNVRRKPTMDGTVVTTKPAGAEVEVQGIAADWMHLKDGTFILYGGGKFAEKIG